MTISGKALRPRTGSARACSCRSTTSKPGTSRSAPINQPRYQSGCAPFVADQVWYGPHSQIGLICTSPPSRKSTPAVASMRPSERGAWPGHVGTPTTACSVSRALLELRVVAQRDEREVRAEQRADQDREEQHVRDVEARPEALDARERPAEEPAS